jgi:hypothetical protein
MIGQFAIAHYGDEPLEPVNFMVLVGQLSEVFAENVAGIVAISAVLFALNKLNVGNGRLPQRSASVWKTKAPGKRPRGPSSPQSILAAPQKGLSKYLYEMTAAVSVAVAAA